MKVSRTGGKRSADRAFRATNAVIPPNQLTIAMHGTPGDDGCEPIVNYLRIFRDTLSRTMPITNLTTEKDRSFVLEGPYPLSAAEIVARFGIPPQFVTHVLLLIPAAFDPEGVRQLVHVNQPSAFALGRIDVLFPRDARATAYDDLSEDSRRLISYYES